MKPETDILKNYLICDAIIDWKSPSILNKAQELTENLHDDIDKVRTIFEWVRDMIPNSVDINSDKVTCSASEVLQEGTGNCYAKSHLLAALLRAVSIPSGFCYQVFKREPPLNGFALHGLNGVYFPSLRKWILLDARGNTNSINAQFSIEKDGLAFQPDPKQGEFTYKTIYTCPAPEVIDVIRRFTNRSEMWPHLPASLSI